VIAGVILLAGWAPAARVDTSDDVRTLVAEVERLHPSPYHSVSRADFHRAADDLAAREAGLSREQMLVETMRLVALLGEREGHTGVGTATT
jgi:outer membrane murein-binding lipoprotein Lpp